MPFRDSDLMPKSASARRAAAHSRGDSLASDLDADCCVICLETYSAANPEVRTACGHGYHLHCIMGWSDTGSDKCPLCYAPLRLEDEETDKLLARSPPPPPRVSICAAQRRRRVCG